MSLPKLPPSAIITGGNPARYDARLRFQKYLYKNKIIKPTTCPLCTKERRTEAHHPSYDHAEIFIYICHSCHIKIHHGSLFLINFREFIPRSHWKSFWNHPDNLKLRNRVLRPDDWI